MRATCPPLGGCSAHLTGVRMNGLLFLQTASVDTPCGGTMEHVGFTLRFASLRATCPPLGGCSAHQVLRDVLLVHPLFYDGINAQESPPSGRGLAQNTRTSSRATCPRFPRMGRASARPSGGHRDPSGATSSGELLRGMPGLSGTGSLRVGVCGGCSAHNENRDALSSDCAPLSVL